MHAGKNAPPIYQIRYVESDDGLSGWSEPKVLFSTDDCYFDSVVTEIDGRYEMVVCRPHNLYGRADFPPQGLWWLTSRRPSGDREDWSSKPACILDAEDYPKRWYANGVLGPCVRHGDRSEDQHVMYVFVTGVWDVPSWWRVATKRLLAFEKPPFPAPFYFAVGRAQFKRELERAAARSTDTTLGMTYRPGACTIR